MTLERMYAEALFQAERSGLQPSDLLSGLKAALGRRGHTRLLPRVFREFEKLELQKERIKIYSLVTPEREQTRVLLDLYRSLILSNN